MDRKYLAHYIDANMGADTVAYTRIGKDLEEYTEDLSPDVEVSDNILGEQTIRHNGYEVQSEADPFYADVNDPLYEPLAAIANDRLTGKNCKTTKVDVLFDEDGAVLWAYREDVYLVPSSVGGDTSGVQIPFTVYNAGNRVEGDWSTEDKTINAYISDQDLEAIIAIIEASGILTDDEILTVDDNAVATEEGVQAILDYIEESGVID